MVTANAETCFLLSAMYLQDIIAMLDPTKDVATNHNGKAQYCIAFSSQPVEICLLVTMVAMIGSGESAKLGRRSTQGAATEYSVQLCWRNDSMNLRLSSYLGLLGAF